MHRAWNVNNHGLLLLNNELLEILTVAITAIFEEICEGIYSTKFQPNMAVIAMISVDWEKVHQIFHCLITNMQLWRSASLRYGLWRDFLSHNG
jgi:hypothetical protein